MECKNPYLFPIDLLPASSGVHEGNVHSLVQELPLSGGDWWLVHAKPRQEKKLAEEIRSRGVPHYLPVTLANAVTRGRARFSWLPLFPGYLFLKCTSEQRLAALQTNRIVATHSISDRDTIEQQLATLSDLIVKGVPLRIEERVGPGQAVEVKAGLLKGKRGIVIKRGGKTRLFVKIAELLGGVSVEIEQHYVEPC